MVRIKNKLCAKCGNCVEVCPFGVFEIKENGEIVVAHPERCKKCEACVAACPNNAIEID